METETENVKTNLYPYAPTGSVLSVIRRYRDHGVPKGAIDNTEITRVGVSDGNASRTLAALKFLGLVEGDKLSNKFALLNKATTEEYPNVLGDILRDAYSDIFAILNPSKATSVQITDAFRGKEPEKQRSRMIQLFIGLCQEAQIIEGKPTVVEGRKYTASSPSTNGNEKKKPQQTPEQHESIQQPPKKLDYWDVKFAPYLEELPPSDKRAWKKSKRDKWINAVTAMLDYLIDVDDEKL
jgi:hypothetical protein